MADIIDIDTGTILTSSESIPSAGERLLELVIEVASGCKHAMAEAHG